MKGNLLPGDRRERTGAVLLTAVAVGTILRFFRLGGHELSIDESLSWAESSGHNVKAVLRVQHQLDSGKFPIYELAQHGWMRIFGESETAMRALPALIGSLSIVLVFIVAVEVLLAAAGGSPEPSPASRELPSPVKERARYEEEDRIYMVAALCALLFAVGLPSVEIARQARMYSMMEAWILAQVIFLFRARRLGGFANYAGLTIFSAIAVATNFTAALVIVAEALWLIYLYVADGDGRLGVRARNEHLWSMGAALIAAMVLLLPFFAGLRYGVQGVARGDYDWIKLPGRWEPLATFESALGTFPFPLFAVFASVGGVRLWRSHRDEGVLLVLWIVAPAIVLFAGSYLITPMLITRYLVSSFVPLFILTAIGIESIPARRYRSVAIIAIVSLSVLRASSDFRPGDNRWRDACEIALTSSCSKQRVGTFNEYYLVSYYMPAAQRHAVKIVRVPFEGAEKKAPQVVILSPTVSPGEATEIRREYPVVVAKFKNLTVVSRPKGCPRNAPAS
jgi:mannosyltransferase